MKLPTHVACQSESPGDAAYAVIEAKPESVVRLLAMDPNLPDGFTRSQHVWIRLPGGDLILGVFPQDAGYEEFTDEAAWPPSTT